MADAAARQLQYEYKAVSTKNNPNKTPPQNFVIIVKYHANFFHLHLPAPSKTLNLPLKHLKETLLPANFIT